MRTLIKRQIDIGDTQNETFILRKKTLLRNTKEREETSQQMLSSSPIEQSIKSHVIEP